MTSTDQTTVTQRSTHGAQGTPCMRSMTPQERYAQEEARSQRDHHVPTAGAMSSHVISNLALHILAIRQARWFAKGVARLFLERHARPWISYELRTIARLDELLVGDNEMIPTTAAQLSEYGQLDENPALKYASGQEQLTKLIHDFDWQLLFIGKAIALANKEDKSALSSALSDLRAWSKAQIVDTQLFLGREPTEGLYREVDEDEDDDDHDEGGDEAERGI